MKIKKIARQRPDNVPYSFKADMVSEYWQQQRDNGGIPFVWVFVAEGLYYVAFEEANQKKIESTFQHMPQDFRIEINDSQLPTRRGHPKNGTVHFSAGSTGKRREIGQYTPHLRTSGTRCDVKRLTNADVDIDRLLLLRKMPISLCRPRSFRYMKSSPASICTSSFTTPLVTNPAQATLPMNSIAPHNGTPILDYSPLTPNNIAGQVFNQSLPYNWNLLSNPYPQYRPLG